MSKKSIAITNEHAAGIDIGSREVYVSVDGETVRCFQTFTRSFHELVAYLKEQGTRTVCMEATGVYWTSLYELLTQAQFEVYVVNGAHVKAIHRRKTDVKDCRWLQQLHSHGLLRASFIPHESIRQLRTYVRLRDNYIAEAATYIQRMQKASDQMNIRLHTVISSIVGVSGRKIIEAILGGERRPEVLLALCENSIRKNKSEAVLASLEGTYRDDQLFALEEAYTSWKFYQERMHACDKQIENFLQKITADMPIPDEISKPRPTRHREPDIENLHTMLLKLTDGNDPTFISGIVDVSVLRLISETGTDMSKWQTAKHFTSWLHLAPDPKKSGQSQKHIHGAHSTRCAQLFRVIAQAVSTGKDLALVGYYRRICGRKGPRLAMKALARKLAVMYYNVLRYGIHYVEVGLEGYEKQQTEDRLRRLERSARKLNMQVVPIT